MNAKLTSFATYQDLVAFCDCIEAGGAFNKCLSKGDNGRGASGRVTAQTHTPMAALSRATLEAKWGSLENAWGKKIRVDYEDRHVVAEIADYCSEDHVCDLNPASLLEMGWSQDEELSVQGTWKWV